MTRNSMVLKVRPSDDTRSQIFYEHRADAICRETLTLDMTPLYARFLPHLPSRGHILDAGCGCGRDARAFLERGFRVTAFDAAPAMAALAQAHIGQPVRVMRFQDLDECACFNGIWACASLLHVPITELPTVLNRLAKALRPHGILYASFKYGRGEREHQGRRFTDLDEAGLAALLDQTPKLRDLETWVSADLRPDRMADRWLNTLLLAI